MLSENMKELSELLSSLPGESPAVNGHGVRLSPLDWAFFSTTLDTRADDFPGTEALFRSEISPTQRILLLPQE